MQGVERNTGQRLETVTADAGYWDTEAVRQALQSGVQVLVPPDGAAATETCEPRQMVNNPLAQQMRGVLNTEAGRALYRMRQTVVEPVFGSLKELRRFRRFQAARSHACASRVANHMRHAQSAQALPAPLAPDHGVKPRPSGMPSRRSAVTLLSRAERPSSHLAIVSSDYLNRERFA
jgi:Transposase DDE domain